MSRSPSLFVRLAALSVVIVLIVAACSTEPAPTPAPTATLPAGPTDTPPPTEAPTATPVPTAAPTPTATPAPTATPENPTPPTSTPTVVSPTSTPASPTSTPATATSTPAPATPTPSAAPAETPPPPPGPGEVLAEIERRVSEDRGLTETGDLVREFVSQEEMAELIAGLLNFDEEIAVVERVWKLLGLVDAEDSLVDAYTQSYSSSVVGFFQPSEGRIVVLSDGDGLGAYAELVYAHEYVHALQYGTYDIGTLEEAVDENSDADRALTSLVEGDASFLQQRYFQQHLVSRRSEIVRTVESFPEGPEVSTAISDSLIFPYVVGPRFVAALFRSGGWEAVDQAFADPPQSTEQILHPDKYLTGEEPVEVTLPELEAALGDGWERKLGDIVGEFGMILLLQTGLDERAVQQAAVGWGGDRYAYYTGPDGAELIAMLAAWDSEGDADEFFEGYAELLYGLGAEDVVEEQDAVSGVLRDAVHTIRLAGDETLLIIATDAGPAEAALSAFPGFTEP